jgi:putative transcriptional regulator
MTNFGKDLIKTLQQAVDYQSGKKIKIRETVLEVPDIKSIRAQLKLSQSEFSRIYAIPLATLRGWEQGRRQPDRTSAAYLNVIAKMPKETQSILSNL